jgi:uncharacterized delta-60 repeat protein
MKISIEHNLRSRHTPVILTLFFFVLIAQAQVLLAQGNSVDLTFGAAVSRDTNIPPGNELVNAKLALQADGKILIFGNAFNNVTGVPKNKMARLNTDGTLDNSFTCACDTFSGIYSAVAQPDGKNIIAGAYGPGPVKRLARLNSNGSIDYSFVTYTSDTLGSVNVWAVQPDGKIFITEHYSGIHQIGTTLRRLNTNGSVDNSFSPLGFEGWNAKEFLYALQILPDGKIMIGGKHAFGYIFRINSDGTKDTSFESPVMTTSAPQFSPIVSTFGIQSTGKVVIAGGWVTINGLSIPNFARLNADGSVDQTFAGTTGGVIKILSNDKILLNGGVRLNADGTMDNSFTAAYANDVWVVDSLERIVFVSSFTEDGVLSKKVGRMNSDGSSDGTFSFAYVGFVGEVNVLAIQPDGKVLMSGYFNRINGMVRFNFARVNTNGSLDATFDSGTGVGDWYIHTIVPLPDGKILIGGLFPIYNGTERQSLVRINSNGSLDMSFNPILSSNANVSEISVQADGKILIAGIFGSVNGINRTSIARLNSDGTLDTAFNPVLGVPNIYALLVQSDGKIMVGGSFTGVNGFSRSNLARLNSDGTLDTAFNAGSIGSIAQIAQQPDGKYLVISNGAVIRRNNDGTADGSFPAITMSGGSSAEFVRESDGNIIVVGSFSSINGTNRNGIARIRPNGTVDPFFFPVGVDSSRHINTIIKQTDGKYIVGGNFSTLENTARNGVARITPPAIQPRTFFDFDGDGKADVSVFRPSENKWYILRSSDLGVSQQVFAIAGDVPVPADYDGDGKTDLAIFRPSTGDWWSLSSLSGGQVYAHWGASGDIPRPSDFDGDGRADYIVYRPSNFYWYRISSANGAASTQQFGLTGDKPVTGDFDGDGKSDKAIFRPSTGDWWYQSSLNGAQLAVHWGISTDIPAPADFDGDGKTDFCVYRPSTGVWYIINSSNFSFTIMNFGLSEDKPVPADYDGDGKADIAVFRPSSGAWYLQQSTAGFWALNWGISTDIPTENAFVP